MPHRFLARLNLIGALLALLIVSVGAYVRLSDAGLGCPDWPGCYGQIVVPKSVDEIHPDFGTPNLEPAKAWKEMMHRYLVPPMSLLILFLAFYSLKVRKQFPKLVHTQWYLLGVVVFQALLGMWTVTLKLHPLVVMSHLLGGITLLELFWWLTLRYRNIVLSNFPHPPLNLRGGERGRYFNAPTLFKLAVVALIILEIQVALGGWTSSNYAALVCPDFPTCRGSFWPAMDWRHAFQFFREIGPNYEGGLLSPEARVAIHVTHRIGALVTFITLSTLAFLCFIKGRGTRLRTLGMILFVAVCLQIVIGISNVFLLFPVGLAVAHTMGAALLIMSLLAVMDALRPLKGTL